MRLNRNKAKLVIKAKGIRQKWLAEQLGCAPNSVSAWLNGHKKPSQPIVIAMASILGVKTEDIAA